MSVAVKLIFECMVYCGVFFGLVKLSVLKSPLTGVFWYPKDVQERIYDLGLADREHQKRRAARFKPFFIVILTVTLICMVSVVNQPDDFLSAYLQLLLILTVSVWFDKIVIDTIWVGTDFWKIPGTEDLQIKKPLKMRVTACLITPMVYAVLALPVAWMISLFGI
ncbi:MAG: hypothetical protein Q4C82_09850 [Eubacteriales bacterium]|nr:hypothetical protein [Eubacteriales bacterium]